MQKIIKYLTLHPQIKQARFKKRFKKKGIHKVKFEIINLENIKISNEEKIILMEESIKKPNYLVFDPEFRYVFLGTKLK